NYHHHLFVIQPSFLSSTTLQLHQIVSEHRQKILKNYHTITTNNAGKYHYHHHHHHHHYYDHHHHHLHFFTSSPHFFSFFFFRPLSSSSSSSSFILSPSHHSPLAIFSPFPPFPNTLPYHSSSGDHY